MDRTPFADIRTGDEFIPYTLNETVSVLWVPFGSSSKETFRCWLMEVGLQNGTLAIVVANTFFASTVYLIPAAIYSLIMYATALPLIYFLRRN